MRITAYPLLTKNQLKLVKVIANNYAIKLGTLLDMGFERTMINCVQRKGGLSMGTSLIHKSTRVFVPSDMWSRFKLKNNSLKFSK